MSDAAAVAVPTSRSVAILGADAYLAVRPCTPEQLANACLAGGFAEVFPASWGDEIVAAGCLERLERRSGSAIFCACPHVAKRLAGAGELRARLGREPSGVLLTLYYRPDLFGRPFSDALDLAMRGPSDWSAGERELFAAFVSSLNQCPF